MHPDKPTFSMTSGPIPCAELRQDIEAPDAGACVVFEGRVRNHADGRGVLALDYEAYEPLATAEGMRVLAEASTRFAIVRAVAAHRTGSLKIGDLAVWVGVSAAHRGAAFDACRFIIDELKARLPIWKREHYVDGATEWVNCQSRKP